MCCFQNNRKLFKWSVLGAKSFALSAAAIILLYYSLSNLYCQTAAPGRETDINKTLVFGSAAVFYPYSYKDTDGQFKGFAIDVADAVARTMNLRISRTILGNSELAPALRNGKIDVIQFWSETEERRAWAEFSVPIVRFEMVAVVRKDEQKIRRLSDLTGYRVAVGQRGTIADMYLKRELPRAIPVYTETSPEFLRMISEGKLDVAVMSRITAVSMIDRFDLKNLKTLEDRVPGDKYDVRYCFTVRKGDSLLLARLNEGLAAIHRTGEFEDIYRKWFGRYERRVFTAVEMVSYVAAALALACAFATWGFARQRTLKRRITKQAAELAQQRSLLEALFDKHPLATVVIDIPENGPSVLISLNREASRVLGLDLAAAPGCRLEDLPLSADVRKYFDEVLVFRRSGNTSGNWESRFASTQQVIETAIVPLSTGESGADRVCILSADITQRRLTDIEIAQSRRLRALGQLVGGIAHEFNNLLTPILGTIELLQIDQPHNSMLQSSLATINKAAMRAAELTKRLLTFGRKSDDRSRPVQIAEVVVNCSELMKTMLDRRIVWETDLQPNLPPILFNPTDLNQIVFNLVINARDTLQEKLAHFSESQWTPRLRIAAEELPPDACLKQLPKSGREPAAWQRLTVEDNGMGISPELLDRLFEPFFTTKDVGKGTGLGLSTVWRLVTDAGGDVRVESRPGEGSKFHVILPRFLRHPDRLEEEAEVAHATPRIAPCRILLVEDEPLVASAIKAMLERLGHVVTHLADGAEAWDQLSLEKTHYRILLLDVNMPRLNGVDLVRRLRNIGYTARIIVMSGRVEDSDMRKLEELSVDCILPKPFTPAELGAALREVLLEPA